MLDGREGGLVTAARIFVEAWNPEYGASFRMGELAPSTAEIEPSVEVPRESWKPIRPEGGHTRRAETIAFIDGVRRIDALVWIQKDDDVRMGLCASYAAGIVVAGERAEIRNVTVRRGLFASVPDLFPLSTDAGPYRVEDSAGSTLPELTTSLQERLRELESEVAGDASDAELVVVDGPLSTRHLERNRVGYVKSHRVTYLDAPLERTVHQLEAGERTPLFLTTTSWSRYSSYLKLDETRSHPWAGVVRLEMPGELPLDEARALVDRASLALPRYASVPYKDPRAPQNLFPIGGLERELRHRLGDHAFVRRALRVAAS
jgi:hypothetical protein